MQLLDTFSFLISDVNIVYDIEFKWNVISPTSDIHMIKAIGVAISIITHSFKSHVKVINCAIKI